MHCGQSRFMSRCDRMPESASDRTPFPMPRSRSLVTAPAAVGACSVERTSFPASAMRIVSSAVSLSRISPAMMTSGSCRSTLLRASPKLSRPFSGRESCCAPSMRYSTGSSTVTAVRPSVRSALRMQASVVDFPEPVGPVRSTSPGRESILWIAASSSGRNPSSSRVYGQVRGRMRSTNRSPNTVGKEETRTS